MTIQNLTFGKAVHVIIKYLKSLPPEMSWNNVKAVLWQQFSLVTVVIHVTICQMHRYQKKVEGLQELNCEFIELI